MLCRFRVNPDPGVPGETDPPRDDREVLSVDDWAGIRRCIGRRGSRSGRSLGSVISKNPVKKAIADEGPPVYSRPSRGSAVDAEPVFLRLGVDICR